MSNKIISLLFQLLDEPQFRCITKIKTIGSTYMAASGVTPDVSNGYSCVKVLTGQIQMQLCQRPEKLYCIYVAFCQKEELTDRERWQHLADLADFALAMKVTLMNINYQSFNNFMLRIGTNATLLFIKFAHHF